VIDDDVFFRYSLRGADFSMALQAKLFDSLMPQQQHV
jgi:hypothetical protein